MSQRSVVCCTPIFQRLAPRYRAAFLFYYSCPGGTPFSPAAHFEFNQIFIFHENRRGMSWIFRFFSTDRFERVHLKAPVLTLFACSQPAYQAGVLSWNTSLHLRFCGSDLVTQKLRVQINPRRVGIKLQIMRILQRSRASSSSSSSNDLRFILLLQVASSLSRVLFPALIKGDANRRIN